MAAAMEVEGRRSPTLTHFAPAERARDERMRRDVEAVCQSPIVDALLGTVTGLLAVLNEQRQILTVNETLLEMLGVADEREVLGLRPGEALNCIHACRQPGGCGTSRYCATCGAAIAIVVCLSEDGPQRRMCTMTVDRQEEKLDLYFDVQCSPITIAGRRFLLLFMRDVTIPQQRAILERVFFHDVKNYISSLMLNVRLLQDRADEPRLQELAGRVNWISSRLMTEVEIQRTLCVDGSDTYALSLQKVMVEDIVHELQMVFASHSVSRGKGFRLVTAIPPLSLTTDPSLLQRILTNMVINAFEATGKGGEVKLRVAQQDGGVTFSVWNAQVIPEEIRLRIFQRNFSTKKGPGRGLGTYAMKLFGETYLGGKVGFTTSEEGGTEFYLHLPGAEEWGDARDRRAV